MKKLAPNPKAVGRRKFLTLSSGTVLAATTAAEGRWFHSSSRRSRRYIPLYALNLRVRRRLYAAQNKRNDITRSQYRASSPKIVNSGDESTYRNFLG